MDEPAEEIQPRHEKPMLTVEDVRMQQVATLLYLYADLVPEGGSRSRAADALGEYYDAVHESAGLLPKSNAARSSSDFVERLTTGFDLLD